MSSKKDRLKKWFTIAFSLLLPVVDFFLVEGMLGHLGSISPVYCVYNIIAYAAILALLILFFKNIRCSLLIFQGVMIVATLIDYYVYKLRGRPFMLQDIKSATTAARVVAGYSFDIAPLNAIYLTFMVFLLGMMIYLPSIQFVQIHIFRKVIVIAVFVAAIYLFTDESFMNRFSAMSFNQWDIESNYAEKGYIMALLAEMKYCRHKAPEGYNTKEIKQIVEKYLPDPSEGAADIRTPENLIVIMNESWADLRVVGPFEADDTIMPYMDRMKDNTIKGFLHMPVYGAGTANSEYEFLTGNSMQFIGLVNTPYQLYISDPEYGVASSVADQGYHTTALHPYIADNWNRSQVYPKMQFETFYALDTNWPEQYQNEIRWCTSDKASYNMLIEQYKTKEAQDGLLFSFLVTMQNHGGYDSEDFEASVHLNYPEQYPFTEQYLSLVQETDTAFQYLTEYFTTVNEPTMIVMFGDHLPNIEEAFYERLLGSSWDEHSDLDNQKLYTTPFIIWANYDIEEKFDVEMSANYFGSYVLQLAGLEMSDYQRCLLAFAEEMPVMGMGMVMDGKGTWYSYGDMPDRLAQIYHDYEILQYNNVFGGKGRIDDIFTINH